jgi:maltooligosyltrehalose trehalohydrolase
LTHGPAFAGDGTVELRVWAPRARAVQAVVGSDALALQAGEGGWWSRRVTAVDGTDYAFRLDGGPTRPDPASRRQPDGVHGRSRLVDPTRFAWSPQGLAFRARPLSEAVFYELHVGTFTPDGTFAATIPYLQELVDLGVTHVEVMPVNAFSGAHGWGYDGVGWWAVHEPYGGPAGLAAFVDACHRLGLAVVLDVVYNHLGPSGNYLPEFGPYLTADHRTHWGPALNLDGPGSDHVRSFIVGSALAWLRDYRIDGLRLDAVHGLVDQSATHVLTELSDAVARAATAEGRPLQLVAESDRNDPATLRARAAHGMGLDAQWADELHHGLHVALTGQQDGWYADFTGLQDVATVCRQGFLFDGSRYSRYRQRTVGAPLDDDVPGWRLVGCLQNHDQVGNRPHGDRLTTIVSDAALRVAVVLLCTAPHVPLLFMGEEYGETNPFQYFTSHPEPDLAEGVRRGRREEFADFAGFDDVDVPDPQDPATRARSVLDRSRLHTARGQAWFALWHDMLALRRTCAALSDGDRLAVHPLQATRQVLALRRSGVLVTANLERVEASIPVPAVGGEGRGGWTPLLCTDDARYGGEGRVVTADDGTVVLPARTAVVWGASG